MKHIKCRFRNGELFIHSKKNTGLTGSPLPGNGWRGVLVLTGAGLLAYGLTELGLVALGLAFLWSIVEISLSRWRGIIKRQKGLQAVRKGELDSALEFCETPQPGSKLWWALLALVMEDNRWKQAENWLDDLRDNEEKQYLLAVTKFAQGKPNEALALCPSRASGDWMTLKAEALLAIEDWEKVLGVLRGRTKVGSPDALEHTWLKGVSYYYLGQYKPAIRLLRQVVEQGGEDYPQVDTLLRKALTKAG